MTKNVFKQTAIVLIMGMAAHIFAYNICEDCEEKKIPDGKKVCRECQQKRNSAEFTMRLLGLSKDDSEAVDPEEVGPIKRAIKKHVYSDPMYRQFRRKNGYGDERVELSSDRIKVTRCFKYTDGTPGAEATFVYDGNEHKLKMEKHSSGWKVTRFLVNGKDVRWALRE